MARTTSMTSMVAAVLLTAAGCATGSDPALITSVNAILAPDDAVVATTQAIKADPRHAPDMMAAAPEDVSLAPAALPQGVMAQAPFTVPFRTQSRVQFMSGSPLSHSGAY